MRSVARDRIYALCLISVLVLTVLVPIEPSKIEYGRVDPAYTGFVVQDLVENAAFFHSRASGIMAVMILVVVGLYGLHLRTINGTAGDVVQVVGLSFMTLASLANILEKGMSHVVLHTIHFSADTALTYEQAVLFTHHLISTGYSFEAVSSFAGGLGITFFALGLSGKELHRFSRPVCLAVVAVGVGMTANAFIGNVFPLSAGLLPTLINSMALGPMLWMCFMGVLLWKKSGQPWVVAPEEPPPPRLAQGGAAG